MVSDISRDGATLLSGHFLRDNAWVSVEEGKEFLWRTPPTDLRVGTLWSFRGDAGVDAAPDHSADQARDSTGEDREKPRVSRVQEGEESPHPVGEVRFRSLPLRSPKKTESLKTRDALSRKIHDNFAALEAIRQEYFEAGTDTAPHGPLFISVPDHLHLGPLVLHPDGDERWRGWHDAAVELYAPLSSNKYQKIVVWGVERYLLLPRTAPPNPIGSLNFCSDNGLLENWLTAFGHASAEVPSLLSRITDELSQRVPPLPEYAEMRLHAALERIQEDEALLRRVRDSVLEMPLVKELIQEASANAQAEALHTAQESLERMRLEEEQLARRAEISQVLITTLEQQTHQASETAAAASEERSSRFAAQIAEALAAATKQSPAPRQEGIVRRELPARTYPSLPRASRPQDLGEVYKSLRRIFHRWDLTQPAMVAMQLTAAWLCGLAPVVAGAGTGSLLRAAAAVLAAGRLHIEDVASSAAEAADLFGRPHPASGVYLPNAGGLADLFLNEGGGQRLHLIAFQGINRCDADGVFLPLIDSYQGAWHGGRRLPLLHPYSVSTDDPYHPLAAAIWPRNFLPVFVHSSGANGLPLPPAIWANSALIIAEGGASGSTEPVGDLSLDAWTQLRAAYDGQGVPWTEPAPAAGRYQEALQACGAPAEMLAQAIHEALVLPLEVATGAAVSAAGEAQATRVRRALFGGV